MFNFNKLTFFDLSTKIRIIFGIRLILKGLERSQLRINKAEKRQNEIVEMLNSGRTISVDEFSNVLHCSASTIRNDLNYLADRRRIVRVFGGAKGKSFTSLPLLEVPASPRQKEKEIAEYVVDNLIEPQSTIILDWGAICFEIAQLLVTKNIPVSALSCSLPTINILANAPLVSLYSFGGFYRKDRTAFFDDSMIQKHTEYLHADIYFMVASSVSPDAGFTISCQDFPITERAFMKIATKTIALCNSDNLSTSSHRVISDFTQINTMVTDSYANPEHVQKLKEAGLDVMVAQEAAVEN